jgi:hypothetical protein
MPVTDLWGDISVLEVPEPSVLQTLREQALLLGTKTRDLLKADVVTSASGGYLEYEFLVYSPVIDDYRYVLLRVRHSLEEEPPIQAIADDYKWTPLRDHAEFEEWLGQALSSPKTLSKIRILLEAAKGQ